MPSDLSRDTRTSAHEAVATGAGLLAAGLALLAPPSATSAEEPIGSRTFRVTYEATVRDIPAGTKALDVWLPVPQTDRNQAVHRLTIDAPNPVTIGREARFGNQCLHVRVAEPEAP